MAKTLAAGASSRVLKLGPNESRSFRGTLTGTATLSPEVSFDGGLTFEPVASDTLGTAAAYTATMGGAVTITAPSTGIYVRLRNSAGAGSWSIIGF